MDGAVDGAVLGAVLGGAITIRQSFDSEPGGTWAEKQ
jgi:hypothetical protein